MEQFRKTLIIYHNDCLDGFASAAIAAGFLSYGRVDLMAASYLDPVPDMSKYENVYILDFSWEPSLLLPATVELKNVVMIDHHSTSFKAWEGMELPENMHLIHNKAFSGALLTHNFFYPGKEAPLLYQLISDRDLWLRQLDHSFEVCESLRATRMIRDCDWDTFHTIVDLVGAGNPKVIQEMSDAGKRILEYNETLIMNINERCGKDVKMVMPEGTFLARLLNISYELASQCGSFLINNEHYDIVIMYEDLLPEGKRRFSIRSSKEIPFNAADYAELFGGGGHDHASGFHTPLDAPLPF